MSTQPSYLPAGYQTITPYLIVQEGIQAIDFYTKAFDAKEVMRMETPNKKIGHAELTIGGSKFMLADECPETGFKSPKTYGGCSVGLNVYVKNADEVVAQAVQLGAKIVREVKDQFYGDRSGTIEDPFGHLWTIATHIEDVTSEEIQKRAENLFPS
jgi:PhnB protein